MKSNLQCSNNLAGGATFCWISFLTNLILYITWDNYGQQTRIILSKQRIIITTNGYYKEKSQVSGVVLKYIKKKTKNHCKILFIYSHVLCQFVKTQTFFDCQFKWKAD